MGVVVPCRPVQAVKLGRQAQTTEAVLRTSWPGGPCRMTAATGTDPKSDLVIGPRGNAVAGQGPV